MSPRALIGLSVVVAVMVLTFAVAAALPEAPAPPQPRVEELHTDAGIVTITGPARATADDLGVAAFAGAREKESSLWRLKPPKGDEWKLASAEFTSTTALDTLERFYRTALGDPEVRRTRSEGQTVIVLSRAKGPESIVVRIAGAGPPAAATILVRRAVMGSPVTIEPGTGGSYIHPEEPEPDERSIST
ncbi:MAG TPA: hypothetical protein VM221_09990 [Armatimonadota bacterium]|nr:hypothetical protein [Armatimonadota bacterium]